MKKILIHAVIVYAVTVACAYAQTTQTEPTDNSKNVSSLEMHNNIRELYPELQSAIKPYRIAIAQCYLLNKNFTGCNSGTNGIPIALESTGFIKSLAVTNGVITVVPVDGKGLTSEDTYISTPTVGASGETITWVSSGGSVDKGYFQ